MNTRFVRIASATLLSCSILFAGCSSGAAKSDELETRVNELESRIEAPEGISDTDETIPGITEESRLSYNDDLEFSLPLDEKSPAEIAQICQFILGYWPEEGDSYDEYMENLPAKPLRISDDFPAFEYTDDYIFDAGPVRDCVSNSWILGMKVDENRTVVPDVSEAVPYQLIGLEMNVSDINKAVYVYNTLLRMLSLSFDNGEKVLVKEMKNLYGWKADGTIIIEDEDGNEAFREDITFLELEVRTDTYRITALNVRAQKR